jgi:hypothetical protein
MSGTVYMGAINVTKIESESSLSITSSTGNIQLGGYTFPSAPPTENTVLVTDGTGNLSFAPANTRTSVTSPAYTIPPEDDIVAITVAQPTSLTLPDPSTKTVGDIIYIVKEVAGTDVITVNPSASELISGQAAYTFSAAYGATKIYTNGTNWFLLF